MSDDEASSSDVQAQLDELTETLEALQTELERSPRRRQPPFPRPPSMEELRRFTTEVAIPGLVFLLETNLRALRLLQRVLRAAEDDTSGGSDVPEQVTRVGANALQRLESALEDVQDALEGQPTDSEARDLLAEARKLREDIQSELENSTGESPTEAGDDLPEPDRGPGVDVEAELRSIKDQMQDDDDDEDDGV